MYTSAKQVLIDIVQNRLNVPINSYILSRSNPDGSTDMSALQMVDALTKQAEATLPTLNNDTVVEELETIIDHMKIVQNNISSTDYIDDEMTGLVRELFLSNKYVGDDSKYKVVNDAATWAAYAIDLSNQLDEEIAVVVVKNADKECFSLVPLTWRSYVNILLADNMEVAQLTVRLHEHSNLAQSEEMSGYYD